MQAASILATPNAADAAVQILPEMEHKLAGAAVAEMEFDAAANLLALLEAFNWLHVQRAEQCCLKHGRTGFRCILYNFVDGS